MRPSAALWLAISGCFVFTATAASQSLVELAQKEKARRAEIAKWAKTAEVIDADALRRLRTDAFTAIEISGPVSQISRPEPAEPSRPPLQNPNRATDFTPSQSSRSQARQGTVDLGRGWSSGSDYPPAARGWSGGRANPPGGRGWSDRPAADRGYTTRGDYTTSGRGWSRGGESSLSGRGWSERRSSLR